MAAAAVGLFVAGGSAEAAISTFTVDRTAAVSADGTRVTITGTITCTSGDSIDFFAASSAIVGRLFRDAPGTASGFVCTGSPQPWSVTGTAFGPRLLPGPAYFYAAAYDSTDSSSTSLRGLLRLVPGGSGSPAGTTATVTVDPTATLSADGTQLALSGTITCPSGDSVDLTADVYVTVRRLLSVAGGSASIGCTGGPQPWSVSGPAMFVRLVGGPANVFVTALDTTRSSSVSFAGSIRLVPAGPGGEPAPGPASILTIDPTGTISADGSEVTVAGTITCPAGDLVDLSDEVFQFIGRIRRGGDSGPSTIDCNGRAQDWTLTGPTSSWSGPNAAVIPGPADVVVNAVDETESAFASYQGVARLWR